jgi:chemotaxis protein CheX
MDVKFINPFLQGTVEVLNKMAFMDPRPGKVYLKENNTAAGDVSGIIGITGDATGSLAISFSDACICHIVGRMLGETFATANNDVFDAVGEITNMISGVARTYLEKDGMAVYAAIPSVIFGKHHTIDHILDAPSIIIPFSTEKGTFVVDVCLKTTASDSRNANHYQVQNRQTLAPSPAQERTAPTTAPQSPAGPVDRKALLSKQLRELIVVRDDMVKQLSEKPFMEISQRTLLKKRIPFLDAKIKRLKLDLTAIEMISKISRDDLDNPKIVQHYQHYEPPKKHP